MNDYILTLCIPTNGISEWVLAVLNSIYDQTFSYNECEVIVVDNGNDRSFCEQMGAYEIRYSNFKYYKSKENGFKNQIKAFKLANGSLIKFVNHRMTLLDGTIEYLITFAKKMRDTKPITYFSNGLVGNGLEHRFDSFDEFVGYLGYISSWSAGICMWREDQVLLNNLDESNSLFPHTDILFLDKKRDLFIVDDTVLFKELEVDFAKKSKYRFFYAFGVVFPDLILNLYKDNKISSRTLLSVLESNKLFLGREFYTYVIRRKKTSYDFFNIENDLNVFYRYKEIKKIAIKTLLYKSFCFPMKALWKNEKNRE